LSENEELVIQNTYLSFLFWEYFSGKEHPKASICTRGGFGVGLKQEAGGLRLNIIN
jgi:hypothetical protein